MTLAKTDRPASVRQLYLITADYLALGGLKLRSDAAISCQWRFSVSVTLTHLAGKARLYLTSVQLRRDFVSTGRSRQRYTCVLAYVHPPTPPPVHGRLEIAGQETAGGQLPSCPTLITRHGNKQTMNVSACKFAETWLTVKQQRYPIID